MSGRPILRRPWWKSAWGCGAELAEGAGNEWEQRAALNRYQRKRIADIRREFKALPSAGAARLLITDTELKLMAAAASIGLSSKPKNG